MWFQGAEPSLVGVQVTLPFPPPRSLLAFSSLRNADVTSATPRDPRHSACTFENDVGM
jgi:hypothetical protein